MTESRSPPTQRGQRRRAAARPRAKRQGLHIAALAAAIKVAPRKLDALENDRYDELPDATFTRALAQTVCRTLKIDAAPVLALLPQAGDHGAGAGGGGPEHAVPRAGRGTAIPADGRRGVAAAGAGPRLALHGGGAGRLLPAAGLWSPAATVAPCDAAAASCAPRRAAPVPRRRPWRAEWLRPRRPPRQPRRRSPQGETVFAVPAPDARRVRAASPPSRRPPRRRCSCSCAPPTESWVEVQRCRAARCCCRAPCCPVRAWASTARCRCAWDRQRRGHGTACSAASRSTWRRSTRDNVARVELQ